MIRYFSLLCVLHLLFIQKLVFSQFAPQALLTGSTAIYKDSNSFIEWASNCQVKRGWLDIGDTTLGKVMFGDSTYALGKADANVVSLGDGGEAIYFFENPIVNGNGYDFAIFENGFRNPLDSNLAYLELASVEVSNDGLNYFAFQNTCNNDTILQMAGTGEYMDARNINNLAGKYIANYGTPFDLEELSFVLGLDLDNIRFIRIKDVVGTIDEFATFDFHNHKINDPYPTPFPTGGFDLDALGIIHQKYPTGIQPINSESFLFYPNPSTGLFSFQDPNEISLIIVYAIDGKELMRMDLKNIDQLDLRKFSNGVYHLKVILNNGKFYHQCLYKNE